MAADNLTQVMMTLSGLAGTAAVERPSGESVAAQEARIFKGISSQLADTSLATGGVWQIVWLGLTRDRANLAFIAANYTPGGPRYAVVLRGTVFSMPLDTAEDMDVGVLLPFDVAGPGAKISQGSMQALTEIVTAVCHPGVSPVPELANTTLVGALAQLSEKPVPTLAIFVTGHSLGGAMATTVGLYLKSLTATGIQVPVYTFAAPTAGDRGFASAFNAALPDAVCVWNFYDAVPNAWANLMGDTGVQGFFPRKHGPVATPEVKVLVKKINDKAGGQDYWQPTQQAALNQNYDTYDHAHTHDTTDDWLDQVAYQHQNNTYLLLLGAPPLTALPPSVSGISPPSGPAAGGTVVTITGANFTSDCAVDFGVVSGTSPTFVNSTTLKVTSPPGIGIVDVTVTNMFGTSTADITKYAFAFMSR